MTTFAMSLEKREEQRLMLQAALDDERARRERNKLGQFATPQPLARAMLCQAATFLRDQRSLRFLDPAIGTGAFYSAFLDVFGQRRVEAAVGYEIDPYYGLPAKRLWDGTGVEFRLEDFTRASPPPPDAKCDLLVCNPPYVRHHHLTSKNGEKRRLRSRARRASGIELSGLAGLYCYFMVLAHDWLADGGLAGWLVPSEFMDVGYGEAVKRYLIEKVTLLRIHRFDQRDTQFPDALVSSAVVWYWKRKPPPDHKVSFTFGGSLERPEATHAVATDALRQKAKWTRRPTITEVQTDAVRVSSFFSIKRGQVTGDNSFFILTDEDAERRGLPREFLRPLLPSPRFLPDEVPADENGRPLLDRRLVLLDCRLPEEIVRRRHPALWRYLEEGKARGVAERYLCRSRSPWYVQERRSPTPFVCTYIGRMNDAGKPFRFILNHSRATAANVYLLMYPHEAAAHSLRDRPALVRQVWRALREISAEALLSEGRVYGGGLHKIEPRELGNVAVPALAKLLPTDAATRPRQADMLG